MPIHDWRRVQHDLPAHQQWAISICDALNAELLPLGYSAAVEYSSGQPERLCNTFAELHDAWRDRFAFNDELAECYG